MREIIASEAAVERVVDLLTMQLGPAKVPLTVNVRFRRGLDVQQLEFTIARLEKHIQGEGTHDREDFYRSRLPSAAWECAAGCLGRFRSGVGEGSWFTSGL
jgi:hypothetical protein